MRTAVQATVGDSCQQWPRSVETRLKALAIVCCVWATLISVGHAQVPDRQLVVLGRDVACRAAPALSGSVVVRLDVADLLNRAASESGAPDWVPVEVAGGRVCFVSRRLAANFDVDFPERAVIAIVESTARLTGRIPFDRMAAVHALFLQLLPEMLDQVLCGQCRFQFDFRAGRLARP